MRPAAVYVRWLDHTKSPEGDPKALKPIERRTLGWVVKETPEYLVLAMDVNGKRQDKSREFGFCIVKSLILHRQYLYPKD